MMKKKSTKTITSEELDQKFDAGEDISKHIDWSKATRLGQVDEKILGGAPRSSEMDAAKKGNS